MSIKSVEFNGVGWLRFALSICVFCFAAFSAYAAQPVMRHTVYLELFDATNGQHTPLSFYPLDDWRQKTVEGITSALYAALQQDSGQLKFVNQAQHANITLTLLATPFVEGGGASAISNTYYAEYEDTPYLVRNIVSPWLSGRVLYDSDKVVSARLFVPLSPMARFRELYYMAVDKWEYVSNVSVFNLLANTIGKKEYENINVSYSSHYIETGAHLSYQQINTFFGESNPNYPVLAALFSMGRFTDGVYALDGYVEAHTDMGASYKDCLTHSAGSYRKVYSTIMHRAFAVGDKKEATTDDVIPSCLKQRACNCFVK